LDIRFLPEAFRELTSRVESFADEIGISVLYLETPPQDLMEMQRAALKLRNNIGHIDKGKFQKYREFSDRRTPLTLLRDQ